MQKLVDAETELLDPVMHWSDQPVDRVVKDAQEGELLGKGEF